MQTEKHLVSNGAGWRLALFQSWDPSKLVPGRNPVAIVPGYGMNSFIFGYHPRGLSLEQYLVEAGFEVWRMDLRGQGAAVREGGLDNYSLEDLALTDLGVAVDALLARSRTGATRVDILGASLGGTIMFLHAALNPAHRFGALVSMGAPVRWVKIHPLLRALFTSPTLVGLVPVRGTRRLAELALPLLVRHAPWLLSIYLNPAITDTRAAREMARTVEDPNRFVNRQIAQWLHARDLVVRGTNLSDALRDVARPLLCVVANRDGVVPYETASFPFHQVRSRVKALLEVGDKDMAVAHADLFISDEAHARVFHPLATWLAEQNEAGTSRS
jgi:pimeloyl-ACP methyl ester carboxylesterase